MTIFSQPWLSEDEVLFQRMELFHRQRVEAISLGQSPLTKLDDGILIIHLIPRSCVQSRILFDGATLKKHCSMVPPIGGRAGNVRFNVDGVLRYDGHKTVIRAYSQFFRDGRLEAAIPEITFPMDAQQKNSVRCICDSICEQAAFETVAGYLEFCKSIGLEVPIQMFTALVGCKDVRICTNLGYRDVSEHGIDRSPVFFPVVEIAGLDVEPVKLLRQWCDVLWQACGMERSFNFDQDGKWQEWRPSQPGRRES